MQKVSPFSNNKNLLPCIYGEPSKRNFRSISHKSHKENIHTENSCTEKAIHHASTNRFAKKMSTQNIATKFQQLKGHVSEEKAVKCVETKRKFSRPWIDKEIDFNKQTLKNDQLQSLLQENASKAQKIKFGKKSLLEQEVDATMANFSKTKDFLLNKTKRLRAASDRNDSVNRQKINSCKIAMKKGVFPLNKKHYEQLKVIEYFDREQTISIINKADCEEINEQFISIDSFLNIVF